VFLFREPFLDDEGAAVLIAIIARDQTPWETPLGVRRRLEIHRISASASGTHDDSIGAYPQPNSSFS
jgi:hypothetical protein